MLAAGKHQLVFCDQHAMGIARLIGQHQRHLRRRRRAGRHDQRIMRTQNDVLIRKRRAGCGRWSLWDLWGRGLGPLIAWH
ncbi:hypothetical protein D3C86_1919630 [compost metagenome]